MISEIVLFSLPEGMSREDVMAKYRSRVPVWQGNPDLIHKAFLYDEASPGRRRLPLEEHRRGEEGTRPNLPKGNSVDLRS